MQKKAKNRKSVFYQWIKLYFSVIFVILIVLFGTLVISDKIISKKLYEQQESVLSFLQDDLDSFFSNIETAMMNLTVDKNILGYLDNKIPGNGNIYLYEKSVSEIMKNSVIGYEYISDVFVYSDEHNRLLNTQCAGTVSNFYETYFKNYYSPEKFKSILKRRYKNEYIYFTRSTPQGDAIDYIANVMSLPLYSKDDTAKGNMLVLVDMNKLCEFIHSKKTDENIDIRLLDYANNEICFKEGRAYLVGSNLSYEDIETDNYGKIKGLISVKKNFNRGIIYMIFENDPQIAKLMRNRIEIFIVLLLCIALLSAFVIYKITRKNYSALHNIVSRFGEGEPDQNEFEFLDSAIKDLLLKYRSAEERYENQSPLIKPQALSMLLKKTDSRAIAAQYNISFRYDYFCVVGFCLSDFGIMRNKDDNIKDTHDRVFFVLKNIYTELLEKEYSVNFCESDNIIFAIINFKDDNNDVLENIKKICHQGMTIIKKEFEISFFVSVSEIGEQTESLNSLYKQVIEKSSDIYREYAMREKDEISSTTYSGNNVFIMQLPGLYRQIGNFDFSKAVSSIKSICLKDIANGNANFSKMRLEVLSAVVLEAVSTVVDEELFSEIKNDITVFNRFISCEQYIENVEKAFSVITKNTHSAGIQNDSFVQTVRRYISDNYKDGALSLQQIADYMGISVSALSNDYKKRTNETVLDYIHFIRAEKSKELLQNTSLSIKEISSEIGYEHAVSFTRMFKRYEGITPEEYRTVHSN